MSTGSSSSFGRDFFFLSFLGASERDWEFRNLDKTRNMWQNGKCKHEFHHKEINRQGLPQKGSRQCCKSLCRNWGLAHTSFTIHALVHSNQKMDHTVYQNGREAMLRVDTVVGRDIRARHPPPISHREWCQVCKDVSPNLKTSCSRPKMWILTYSNN